MTYVSLIFALIGGGIAAVMVAIVLIAAIRLSQGDRHGDVAPLFPYSFPLIFAASAITLIAAGRSFGDFDSISPTGNAKWLVRVTSAFIVISALAYLLPNLRRIFSRLDSATAVFYSVIAYWAGTVLVPALFSANPRITHEYFYSLLLVLACAMADGDALEKSLRGCRDMLLVLFAVSLALSVLTPAMVVDPTYSRGFLPGLSRFSGLFNHPVAAAGYAQLLGVLLWYRPYASSALRKVSWLVCVLCLIWAQSKTVWLSSLLSVSLIAYYQGGLKSALRIAVKSKIFAFSLVAFAIVLVSLLLYFTTYDAQSASRAAVRSDASADLMSFTGRDIIWEVALSEWKRSPIFGFGPSLFDIEYRRAIAMPFATHGHNQLIDALARGGVVALLSTILYALYITAMAVHTSRRLGGLPLVLWSIVLVRCISEIPLSVYIYGPEAVPHLLSLIAVSAMMRSCRS